MAHFGHRTHTVVRHRVHDDGRAANAIAFIANFFVAHTFKVTGRLVDVALDIVGGHVGRFGLVHGQAQSWIGIEVTATGAGRHHDFTNDARPDLAAFFILATLAVLDVGPFAMSCHRKSSCLDLIYCAGFYV